MTTSAPSPPGAIRHPRDRMGSGCGLAQRLCGGAVAARPAWEGREAGGRRRRPVDDVGHFGARAAEDVVQVARQLTNDQ
jgi:hypothetical protein